MVSNTSTRLESTQGSRRFILFICLAFRWWNAYMTRTYDNPDEYWQGPEIAHRLVFGQGYVSWEWEQRIRSYFHPLLFAGLYKILDVCQIHTASAYVMVPFSGSTFLLLFFLIKVLGPKLLQATISSFGDLATYRLAKKFYGNDIAPFIATRTLSNTLETTLTILAMNDWPWPDIDSLDFPSKLTKYRQSLFWASLACVARPTNAIIWVYLGLQLLYRVAPKYRGLVLANALVIVPSMLMANSLLDSWLFQEQSVWWQAPVFVPWTFLKTNVFQSIAVFYGAHPIHWYVTQGLPFMLTTLLPWTLIGMWRSWPRQQTRSLYGLVVWVVVVYSVLSHKEFRFLYPIFPLLLIFAAYGVSLTFKTSWRWWAVVFIGVSQLALGLYLCLWHQRGVVDVMAWLGEKEFSAGFLMPCHSTPWYSSLHPPRSAETNLWFLTCEPPLDGQDMSTYTDQADAFYADPLAFVQHLPYAWPDYLVVFDDFLQTQPVTVQWLAEQQGYAEIKRFFNSHGHWDHRRQGDVVVFQKIALEQ
ncbi:hypothetical protein DM01DRAFT_1366683 [Hesseltinella vesiculosa]|uniref:Mannosyltransferase n=1 Tax=Hesseltinella vesiculosa TaxID=101127 RepID=A0A1X2GKV9_9FUNG|nr:hypothetical protein DM01DRAFT_1366683 [Hesseltinella vesiculosa]